MIGEYHNSDIEPQFIRTVSPDETEDDVSIESKIRPKHFAEYPGQDRVKANLEVYVKAAKKRNGALDHVLLHGPPGLGKTTLGRIIANELDKPFTSISGPSIDRAGDLAGILAGLVPGSVLFIDEIHRLAVPIEEILYGAMEDFRIDVIIGQGPSARSVPMPLANFTLVGATTRLSLLSRPLLSRFGIQERLEFYEVKALTEILLRSGKLLQIEIDESGAKEVAMRSRGTPRVANRLLKRVWDFAVVEGKVLVDKAMAAKALERQEIDKFGLDRFDRVVLDIIHTRYADGPVGLDTLAASIGEEKSTLEEVIEPFLVHEGFLARGPRGRYLTTKGLTYLERVGP